MHRALYGLETMTKRGMAALGAHGKTIYVMITQSTRRNTTSSDYKGEQSSSKRLWGSW